MTQPSCTPSRPTADPAPESARLRTPGWARRLAGYCLRHRADLAWTYGAALVAAVATAALPMVLRDVVDRVDVLTAQLTPWVLLLLGLGAVRFGGGFLRRYCSGRVSLGVQYDLRNDVLAALLRLDGPGQDELPTGQVVSRAISDVTLIQMLLQFLPNMCGNALMFVVSVVLMATLSLPLTLVALVVGPALWLIAVRSRQDLFPASWHAQQEAAEVASVVEAAVAGVRVVKGFGQEQRELAALEQRARGLFASRVRVARLTSRYNPALQAVPALGQVAVRARDSEGRAGFWPLPLAAAAPGAGGLLALAWVAFKVGALSYGGGFVIIPLMQSDAVGHYHWTTSGQFLNAVALGQITPGPVVQTVAVVGYAAAGVGGGLLAAAVAFTPSFLFVLLGGRHFDRLRANAHVQAFLTGAGPAVVGAIAGSAIPLALALTHAWQYAVLVVAAIWLLALRGVVSALLGAGALGVVVALAGQPVG